MKIDYMSDLHFEFSQHRRPLPNIKGGDVLILAGDITTAAMFRDKRTDKDARSHSKFMNKFKKDVIDKYNHVLYIMGNHEHYNSIFHKTLLDLKEGFSRHGMEKILFCDNHSVIIDDTMFVGSTLWSDFEKGSDFSMYMCGRGMNDFRVIGSMDVEDMNYFNRYTSRTITPEFILEEHKKSLEFLKTNVALGNKVVVFTHHGPTNQSLHPDHIGNGMDGAYCSDLSEFILDNPQIKVWIHGHTHQNKDYMVGECRVVAKQQGYYMERSYSQFDGPGTVEI